MMKRTGDAMLVRWRQEFVDLGHKTDRWRLATHGDTLGCYGQGLATVSVFCWRRVER